MADLSHSVSPTAEQVTFMRLLNSQYEALLRHPLVRCARQGASIDPQSYLRLSEEFLELLTRVTPITSLEKTVAATFRWIATQDRQGFINLMFSGRFACASLLLDDCLTEIGLGVAPYFSIHRERGQAFRLGSPRPPLTAGREEGGREKGRPPSSERGHFFRPLSPPPCHDERRPAALPPAQLARPRPQKSSEAGAPHQQTLQPSDLGQRVYPLEASRRRPPPSGAQPLSPAHPPPGGASQPPPTSAYRLLGPSPSSGERHPPQQRRREPLTARVRGRSDRDRPQNSSSPFLGSEASSLEDGSFTRVESRRRPGGGRRNRRRGGAGDRPVLGEADAAELLSRLDDLCLSRLSDQRPQGRRPPGQPPEGRTPSSRSSSRSQSRVQSRATPPSSVCPPPPLNRTYLDAALGRHRELPPIHSTMMPGGGGLQHQPPKAAAEAPTPQEPPLVAALPASEQAAAGRPPHVGCSGPVAPTPQEPPPLEAAGPPAAPQLGWESQAPEGFRWEDQGLLEDPSSSWADLMEAAERGVEAGGEGLAPAAPTPP